MVSVRIEQMADSILRSLHDILGKIKSHTRLPGNESEFDMFGCEYTASQLVGNTLLEAGLVDKHLNNAHDIFYELTETCPNVDKSTNDPDNLHVVWFTKDKPAWTGTQRTFEVGQNC